MSPEHNLSLPVMPILLRSEPTRRLILALLLAALSGVLCNSARAHLGGHTGYASIVVDGAQVRYRLQLSAVAFPPALADRMKLGRGGPLPDLEPLLDVVRTGVKLDNAGTPCEAGPGAVIPPPPDVANVTVVVDYVCTQPLAELNIRDDLSDALGSDYRTLARVEWPSGNAQFAFQPDDRQMQVKIGAPQSGARGAASFFSLGIEHILTGFDHILFLLALILRGGNLWSLLKIVTAFTIAHSITLALSVLGIVTVPAPPVEAVIALSIAYVAAENLFMRNAVSHRWAVSFIFGLVHGFGFSSVLRELGLPQDGLAWSLLNFNLGVEVGQACVILMVVPLVIWIRSARWQAPITTTASALVLVVGLALFAGRIWGV